RLLWGGHRGHIGGWLAWLTCIVVESVGRHAPHVEPSSIQDTSSVVRTALTAMHRSDRRIGIHLKKPPHRAALFARRAEPNRMFRTVAAAASQDGGNSLGISPRGAAATLAIARHHALKSSGSMIVALPIAASGTPPRLEAMTGRRCCSASTTGRP